MSDGPYTVRELVDFRPNFDSVRVYDTAKALERAEAATSEQICIAAELRAALDRVTKERDAALAACAEMRAALETGQTNVRALRVTP